MIIDAFFILLITIYIIFFLPNLRKATTKVVNRPKDAAAGTPYKIEPLQPLEIL